MTGKPWAIAAALLGILACAPDARAEFRLLGGTDAPTVRASGLTGGAKTMTLQLNERTDAPTVETHGRRFWYGGHGGWGGHRGWGWGGYRGWGWGGYPYAYSYYRPYYYAPYYSSYYYPSYYYAPPVYYYSSPFCWFPVSLEVSVAAPNGTAAPPRNTQPPANGQPPAGSQPPTGPNGTYPYDGGPTSPVPMLRPAQRETKPAPTPAPSVPLEGRSVSLPAKPAPKYSYPAYGEQPTRPQFAQDRVAGSR